MKFPRWLSWLFVLALGYMVYSASHLQRNQTPNVAAPATIPVITAETYPALAELTDTERWKRAINPDYAATMNCSVDAPTTKGTLKLKVIEEIAGEGAGATCGETVSLKLTLWDAKGAQRYQGSVSLALGSRDVASALDYGLMGIAPGGVRLLTIPPYAQAHSKSKPANGEVEKLRQLLTQNALVVIQATRTK